MNIDALIGKISPPIDGNLATALVAEFIALERRFVLGDWEPATLDGGQFAEVASRIVYHIDSGILNRRKGVNACLNYIEDTQGHGGSHAFPNGRAARHICKALRMIYKFRSQRGAIHIDNEYTANELDSTLILSVVRWVMSEILRIFWTSDTSEVARAIREIIRYPVPSILEFDGRSLVLRTDCTAEEEILLLLHDSGEGGLSRRQIGESAMRSSQAVTNSLTALSSPAKRQIVKQSDGQFLLTPNGTRRIYDELSEKLSLA